MTKVLYLSAAGACLGVMLFTGFSAVNIASSIYGYKADLERTSMLYQSNLKEFEGCKQRVVQQDQLSVQTQKVVNNFIMDLRRLANKDVEAVLRKYEPQSETNVQP